MVPVLVAGCLHAGRGPKPPLVAPAEPRCAPEVTPATALLQSFRSELCAQARKDPTGFLFSFPDTVAAFVRANRPVLAEEARLRFLALPKLDVPDLDALPDDPRADAEVAERIQQLIANGNVPEPAATLVRLPTNLLDRFAAARAFALGWDTQPGSDRFRDRLVEMFAAPRVVRLNDDPTHPILALPRRDDLFVIWFAEAADGAVPGRIRWVRRKRPAEPDPAAATADQAYLSFSLAMGSVAVPKDLRPVDLNRYLTQQSEAMRRQWLQPHRNLLRQDGACAFQRLPLQPLPDLSTWHDESALWAPADLNLPSQAWNAEAVFSSVRTFLAVRSRGARAFALSKIFDQVEPPAVTRANSDPDHPVLALVDQGTALVVTLRVSEATGYQVESVKYARQSVE